MQLLKENMRKISCIAVKTFIVLYIMMVVVVGSADYIVPDKITLTQSEINNASVNVSGVVDENTSRLDAKLLGIVPIKSVELEIIPDNSLVPCGNVFGVKFFTKGVMVIRLSEIETKNGPLSPAKEAGINVGDIIISVDGKQVNTVEEMADVVEASKGKTMSVVFVREGQEKRADMTPLLSLSDRKYKTGIWVRDSTAGIGTMTYYNPKTGEFAGLGHGICDVDTGLLMPLLKGSVVDVEITDIIKGRRGSPGELRGNFDSQRRGVISENTTHGVYGIMEQKPVDITWNPLEIALKDEITEGDASILCELDDAGIKEYKIRIDKIRNEGSEGKNFVIEVVDKELLNKTGGIVQGMSGSPIIQNGKLVGAITHVLVNTPEKGYGIFIENMLSHEE